MNKEHPDFKAFMGIWEVWKKYHDPSKMTDEDWHEFTIEASDAAYIGSRDLASELVKAISNTLDERDRNEKNRVPSESEGSNKAA